MSRAIESVDPGDITPRQFDLLVRLCRVGAPNESLSVTHKEASEACLDDADCMAFARLHTKGVISWANGRWYIMLPVPVEGEARA